MCVYVCIHMYFRMSWVCVCVFVCVCVCLSEWFCISVQILRVCVQVQLHLLASLYFGACVCQHMYTTTHTHKHTHTRTHTHMHTPTHTYTFIHTLHAMTCIHVCVCMRVFMTDASWHIGVTCDCLCTMIKPKVSDWHTEKNGNRVSMYQKVCRLPSVASRLLPLPCCLGSHVLVRLRCVCLRCASDVPQMCAWDVPQMCLRCAWDVREMYLVRLLGAVRYATGNGYATGMERVTRCIRVCNRYGTRIETARAESSAKSKTTVTLKRGGWDTSSLRTYTAPSYWMLLLLVILHLVALYVVLYSILLLPLFLLGVLMSGGCACGYGWMHPSIHVCRIYKLECIHASMHSCMPMYAHVCQTCNHAIICVQINMQSNMQSFACQIQYTYLHTYTHSCLVSLSVYTHSCLLSLSVFLSLSLVCVRTRTLSHSLSLRALSHTLTFWICLSLSLFLTLSLALSLALFLTFALFLACSIAFSLSHFLSVSRSRLRTRVCSVYLSLALFIFLSLSLFLSFFRSPSLPLSLSHTHFLTRTGLGGGVVQYQRAPTLRVMVPAAYNSDPLVASTPLHNDMVLASLLQCVAVCCSVLQCVAVRCSVYQCVAVW